MGPSWYRKKVATSSRLPSSWKLMIFPKFPSRKDVLSGKFNESRFFSQVFQSKEWSLHGKEDLVTDAKPFATTFNDTLHLSRVKLCAAAEDGSVWKLMFRMIRMNEADGRLLGSQSVSWSISSFGWTVHTGFFSTSFGWTNKNNWLSFQKYAPTKIW